MRMAWLELPRWRIQSTYRDRATRSSSRPTPPKATGSPDWISRAGRQEREVKGVWYRRTADLLVSETDPDASPMKRKGGDHSHLGYQTHCVVDGGKSRGILGVLVTPFEVTENKPMPDMLWRTAFRYKVRPRQVTCDSAYLSVNNTAATEKMGIRAYVALKGAGQGRPFFGKDEFTYDAGHDLYLCPAGESLRRYSAHVARRLVKYRAGAGTCEACTLKPRGAPRAKRVAKFCATSKRSTWTG